MSHVRMISRLPDILIDYVYRHCLVSLYHVLVDVE